MRFTLHLFLSLLAASFLFAIPSFAQSSGLGLGLGRLVSPGDLAAPHKKWDSVKSCVDCHDLRGGVNEEKCLDCHKALAARIAEKKGYHASQEVTTSTCISCHHDHKGRKYSMISWKKGMARFDHAATGYLLEAKHKEAKCEKCHDKKTEAGAVTFLGLDRRCASCHKDVHEKSLGGKCEECHNSRSFKGLDLKFNHDKQTRYPLIGKHKRVGCAKCHTGQTKDRAVFGVVNYTTCVTCHKKEDPHKGSLGEKCKDCHTSVDWKKVTAFKHEKTRFPLKGKHRKTDCKSCHPGARSGKYKVAAFGSCTEVGCHDVAKRGVVHGKQFAGRNCANCHTEKGWEPTTFDHNAKSYEGFKLRGKHVKKKCAKCHWKTGKIIHYKKRRKQRLYRPINAKSCSAARCHSPERKEGRYHGAQFADKKCDDCHTVNGWKMAKSFNHDTTRFRLKEKHRQVKCASCHTKGERGLVRYKPIDSKRCSNSGCHDKPKRGAIHGVQFDNNDCGDCHTLTGWKPTTFTHTQSRFKLLGKHQKTPCVKCHVPSKKERFGYGDRRYAAIHYKPVAFADCATSGCHVDPHKGSLKPRECSDCHVDGGWKEKSVFDHTFDTHFPLIGKHAMVSCVKCHQLPGASKPTWKPVKNDCIDCHKKDDKHKGRLGEACGDCHHTTGWDPKVVAHDATGFPLKETHAQLVCADCHKKKGAEFTGLTRDCLQCHTEPHLNQFGRTCDDCHTMTNWEPMKFRHSLTGFRLDGAHRFAECAACHKNRIYRMTPSECVNCHADLFAAFAVFHGHGDTNCMHCHTTYSFRPSTLRLR